MSIILSLLYVYLIIYTVYMFVLAIRNLKDRPFSIEKRYSIHDDTKHNFGVIIYSHIMTVLKPYLKMTNIFMF